MEKDKSDLQYKQNEFADLLKRTYEKGISDQEITVDRLLEEIKTDIRKVFAQ
ncbi:hypothetical protein [Bacillus sp. B15-48]|uniref:hypothetical protein n=1 Tax=Bacillus sp. B15-48 TaxID=1548601 RepID=UPI00193F3EFA|nr:hypothetical protein [Bacillus sp. B15-48]MBM4761473.1 hypothetical protein [Bacillus sp. B15-48]